MRLNEQVQAQTPTSSPAASAPRPLADSVPVQPREIPSSAAFFQYSDIFDVEKATV